MSSDYHAFDYLENDTVHDPFEEQLNFAGRQWTLHEVFEREVEIERADDEQ